MNEQTQQLNKYRVFVHGFGTGLVFARNRTQAHYLVILHLRKETPTLSFTQPMEISRLWGAKGYDRAIVLQWQAWDEDELQRVSNFRLLSMV